MSERIIIAVFPCGSEVITKMGNLRAMITAQVIRFEKVAYELTYFVESEQKIVWMNEEEFKMTSACLATAIGFKTN